jgi:hypothetical protein
VPPRYTHEWVYDREFDRQLRFPFGAQIGLDKGDGTQAWGLHSLYKDVKAESVLATSTARTQVEIDTDNTFPVLFGTATDTLVPFRTNFNLTTKTWPDNNKRYLTHSPNTYWRWTLPLLYLPDPGSVVELSISFQVDVSPGTKFNSNPDHPHEQFAATISFASLFAKVENLISYAYEADVASDEATICMVHMLWRGVLKPNLPSNVTVGFSLIPQLENLNQKYPGPPELLPLNDNTIVSLSGWVTLTYLYTTLRPYQLNEVLPSAQQT